MEDQLGALGLILNCIVLWNTRYMNAALDRLRAQGYLMREADVARLSPFVREHLNVYLDKLQTCYVAGPGSFAARPVPVMPRHRPQSLVDQKAGSVELMFA